MAESNSVGVGGYGDDNRGPVIALGNVQLEFNLLGGGSISILAVKIKGKGPGTKVWIRKGNANVGFDDIKRLVNIFFLDGKAKVHGVVGAKSAA